jgi:hypothetical protein
VEGLCRAVETFGGDVSFLKKLFGGKSSEPVQRTRVCVECGMPVANHKDWCSILRGQQEMEMRAAK